MTYLLVAIGGALGALARFGLAGALGSRGFLFGTLSVNVVGSFALGFVASFAVAHDRASAPSVIAITVGFLGAFTTFSTFSLDTLALVQSGRAVAAVGYALGSVVLGLVAALLGHGLAQLVS